MNHKTISLVLAIDSVTSFVSGLGFLFFFRPVVTTALPDTALSLYPRMFGATRIGLAVILWMAARDPQNMRNVIPGEIIARILGLAVLWSMIIFANINLPNPLGVPAILVWAIGTIAALIMLGLEGLYWYNTRQRKQS